MDDVLPPKGVSVGEEQLETIVIPRESEVESYYKVDQTISNLKKERHAFMTRHTYILPFLQPGRLVYVGSMGSWHPNCILRQVLLYDDENVDSVIRNAIVLRV